MTSPTTSPPQFEADAGLSNLDRCNLCGAPRSAHGTDWSCPTREVGHTPAILLVLGSLLVIVGALVASLASATAVGSLGMTCLLTRIRE
jgi:hypothetical protein